MRPVDTLATAKAAARIVSVRQLNTAQEATQAAAVLRALHQVYADAEDARKAAKRPHLDAGRAVDSEYKPGLEELQRVMSLIKDRLEERALAQDSARARALAAPPEEANALLAELGDETHERISERWTWEVDQVNMSQVPIEFLALDEKKIKTEIRKADKEARQPRIPGITFRRRVRVVARRK